MLLVLQEEETKEFLTHVLKESSPILDIFIKNVQDILWLLDFLKKMSYPCSAQQI
jgi:hypothetical protein